MKLKELLAAIEAANLTPDAEIEIGVQTNTKAFCDYASTIFVSHSHGGPNRFRLIAAMREGYILSERKVKS